MKKSEITKPHPSSDRFHLLRTLVYGEPTNRKSRGALLEYIKLLANQAADLSQDELLLGNKGSSIASYICGSLAWQGAKGVEGDNWITDNEEPVLYELLKVSGSLDINTNQPDKWYRLFKLVESL